MELLRNLTLTDKTKVYKTALLGPTDPGSSHSIEGFVADDQRGRTDGVQVATFFLSRFLGCKPKEPAARLTFEFVKAVKQRDIRERLGPRDEGSVSGCSARPMQDNSADVRPRSFADQNLSPEHREPFFEELEKVGIDRTAVFPKDTSIVKVAKFRMTFDSGMVLVGTREDLEEKVDIPKDPGPENPVELKDGIDNVLTARRAALHHASKRRSWLRRLQAPALLHPVSPNRVSGSHPGLILPAILLCGRLTLLLSIRRNLARWPIEARGR
jgi:hypothetical protein